MKKKKQKQKQHKPPNKASTAQLVLPAQVIMEKAVIGGDLSGLSPEQRLNYYHALCKSLGLNPLTRPFDPIMLNGKLVFYARKDCADQLRKIHKITLHVVNQEKINDAYMVTVRARMPDGREDEDFGIVPLVEPRRIKTKEGWRDNPKAGQALAPDDYANAVMKTITKAKRRATLSICGLGMLDETELETIKDAKFEIDDTESNVRRATENRLADRPAQNGDTARPPATGKAAHSSAQAPVTEQNYGDVVCHIGKAQGDMLGKKVSELPLPILNWLDANYTTCTELTADGSVGVILKDFNAA